MGRKARLPEFFVPPDEFAVLDAFVAKVARAFGCSACAVMFYDEAGQCLRVLASHGLPEHFGKWQQLAEPSDLVAWVREAVTPLTVNDILRQPSARAFMLDPEGQAMIWFPLFATGMVIGAMAAFHRQRNVFRGSDLELMDLTANQAATIIELYLRLDEVTITDFLSGLRHGAYFEYRVREEIERARRYKHPLSVVIMGVRRTEQGEYHGISSGELAEIAGRITAIVRTTDILTRHNDCVFAALLPETAPEGAEVAAAKLLEEVNAWAGGEGAVQAFVRSLSFPADGDSPQGFTDRLRTELVVMGRADGAGPAASRQGAE